MVPINLAETVAAIGLASTAAPLLSASASICESWGKRMGPSALGKGAQVTAKIVQNSVAAFFALMAADLYAPGSPLCAEAALAGVGLVLTPMVAAFIKREGAQGVDEVVSRGAKIFNTVMASHTVGVVFGPLIGLGAGTLLGAIHWKATRG